MIKKWLSFFLIGSLILLPACKKTEKSYDIADFGQEYSIQGFESDINGELFNEKLDIENATYFVYGTIRDAKEVAILSKESALESLWGELPERKTYYSMVYRYSFDDTKVIDLKNKKIVDPCTVDVYYGYIDGDNKIIYECVTYEEFTPGTKVFGILDKDKNLIFNTLFSSGNVGKVSIPVKMLPKEEREGFLPSYSFDDYIGLIKKNYLKTTR